MVLRRRTPGPRLPRSKPDIGWTSADSRPRDGARASGATSATARIVSYQPQPWDLSAVPDPDRLRKSTESMNERHAHTRTPGEAVTTLPTRVSVQRVRETVKIAGTKLPQGSSAPHLAVPASTALQRPLEVQSRPPIVSPGHGDTVRIEPNHFASPNAHTMRRPGLLSPQGSTCPILAPRVQVGGEHAVGCPMARR